MKKLLSLVLAMLMLLSMAACETNTDETAGTSNGSQLTGNNNLSAAENGAASSKENALKYPLPELKPDGPTSVDLDNEQVIYDKNGIKITYMGIEVGLYGYELKVVVENNMEDNLHFVPCSAVVNGMSFVPSFFVDEDLIAKGSTIEGSINLSYNAPVEDYVYDIATIKCLDLYFGFYYGGTMYGDVQTMVDNNVCYSFTRGQHDHRNDERNIVGELIYENNEMAIYMTTTFEENRDKYYGAATIVNKTSKTITLESLAEFRYVVAPARPHYEALYGIGNTLAPNSYAAKKIFIDEEWSSLDINEIILKKQCYYATNVDYAVAPEQDVIGDDGILSLEKMNCFYEKISVPVTVNKSHK